MNRSNNPMEKCGVFPWQKEPTPTSSRKSMIAITVFCKKIYHGLFYSHQSLLRKIFFYFELFFNYRGVLVNRQCSTNASTASRINNVIGFCINFDDTRRIILDFFAEIDQRDRSTTFTWYGMVY